MALLGVVVLLVGVVAVGCGKKAGERAAEGLMERTLERATGGDADVDLGGGGKDVTIKTDQGTTTMSETASWPADFMTDVPEFKYATIERVSRTVGTKEGQFSMTVWFNSLQEGGVEKYAEDLKAAGWQIQQITAAGKGGMVMAVKGEEAGLSVAYDTEEGTGAVNAFTGMN
jgi:hypothetical protein